MTRAYVDMPLVVGQRVDLPESAAAHLLRVLRLSVGDGCVLFNGDGLDVHARVAAIGKRGGQVDLLSAHAVEVESPLRVVLLQAIARGERMDWILQKATELGVAAVVPAGSERSEVRLDAERADKRLAHWRNVVVSACEQSGRARIPALVAPATLEASIRGLPARATRLLLDPAGVAGVADLAMPVESTVVVAIGPEGGWSPRDRDCLRSAGFDGLRLGPRILRTETAGIAAIAALQARFGDLR